MNLKCSVRMHESRLRVFYVSDAQQSSRANTSVLESFLLGSVAYQSTVTQPALLRFYCYAELVEFITQLQTVASSRSCCGLSQVLLVRATRLTRAVCQLCC